MAKMNLLVDLRVFEDQINTSSNSSLKNIAWQGFEIKEQFSREVVIGPKSVKTLFSEVSSNFTIDSVLNIPTPLPGQDTIEIKTEEDRQSITIPQKIVPKSLILSIDRLLAFAGSDFNIEVTENGTVITWINSLAVGGEEQVEIGDVINVFYNYADFLSAEELNSNLYTEVLNQEYKLVYLESDSKCKVMVNNIMEGDLYPVIVNGVKNPAYFLKSTKVDDIKIINENDYEIKVFLMLAK